MHIPDGFLSTPVWAALNLVSLPAVGLAARPSRSPRVETNAPLLGVLGSFVFAAQMVNFPVAPGTSAHLVGGALLGATVGPRAGIVVMTAVLIIQALIFQDGGLLALGANIFNLAIAGVLVGYVPFALLGSRHRTIALFIGGMLSVFLSGVLALGELALSGVPVTSTIVVLSLSFFSVSAILEGAITAVVVGGLERMNPNWIRRPSEAGRTLGVLTVASFVIVATAFLVASAAPDSLEAIAVQLGIDGRAVAFAPEFMADYRIAGISSEIVARTAAGLFGIALVYAACAAAARLIRRSA
jgi:cobalt/nickel transport system permease protein